MNCTVHYCFLALFASALSSITFAYTISQHENRNLFSSKTRGFKPLEMAYGRSSPISGGGDRSKRQERVGHVVRTELASIIQLGHQIKNTQGYLDDELRRRINVVSADVSPDLRQARITVSIIKPTKRSFREEYQVMDQLVDEEDDLIEMKQVFPSSSSGDVIMDRRRAYSWLVKNTKQIRHALCQRLSHMKMVPNISFVQADVGAAVDVMNLIEKVSKGQYKRENLGVFGADDDNLPEGMYLESELEESEWIDDDDFEDFDDDDDNWEEKDERKKK
jgi:Ribosome-binding factor A